MNIRATIIREQEKVITVRLDDGFGQAEVQVHKENIVAV